jgi:hypothetical protein
MAKKPCPVLTTMTTKMEKKTTRAEGIQ